MRVGDDQSVLPPEMVQDEDVVLLDAVLASVGRLERNQHKSHPEPLRPSKLVSLLGVRAIDRETGRRRQSANVLLEQADVGESSFDASTIGR